MQGAASQTQAAAPSHSAGRRAAGAARRAGGAGQSGGPQRQEFLLRSLLYGWVLGRPGWFRWPALDGSAAVPPQLLPCAASLGPPLHAAHQPAYAFPQPSLCRLLCGCSARHRWPPLRALVQFGMQRACLAAQRCVAPPRLRAELRTDAPVCSNPSIFRLSSWSWRTHSCPCHPSRTAAAKLPCITACPAALCRPGGGVAGPGRRMGQRRGGAAQAVLPAAAPVGLGMGWCWRGWAGAAWWRSCSCGALHQALPCCPYLALPLESTLPPGMEPPSCGSGASRHWMGRTRWRRRCSGAQAPRLRMAQHGAGKGCRACHPAPTNKRRAPTQPPPLQLLVSACQRGAPLDASLALVKVLARPLTRVEVFEKVAADHGVARCGAFHPCNLLLLRRMAEGRLILAYALHAPARYFLPSGCCPLAAALGLVRRRLWKI